MISLIYIYKTVQISSRSSLIFLFLDILQLSILLFLTGGIANPFVVFLIFPCIFSSANLDLKTNIFLIFLTIFSIIFLTFFHKELPIPLSNHFHVNDIYYFSIPLALIVALIFLNYFGLMFGQEAKRRKDALNKMEDIIAKEHELLSLGGQAAAAAHSFGTPFSTIKIISQDLLEQFRNNQDATKDIKLLISQIDRCNEILKRLTLNPTIEDDFIDKDLPISDYVKEIMKSFEQISDKRFILNIEQNSNPLNITKSVEIVYGLRNFIGNANKFAKEKIYLTVKSDNDFTDLTIEDDGSGYPRDILSKIGEPYIRSLSTSNKTNSGLGLGLFIGKTLLEKNYAKIIFRNSKTRGGAEVNIIWKNNELLSL